MGEKIVISIGGSSTKYLIECVKDFNRRVRPVLKEVRYH